VEEIYNLEIGKILHKIHSGNPPDNFKQLFTPLSQNHFYAARRLHEERSSGKQHQINTEKDQ